MTALVRAAWMTATNARIDGEDLGRRTVWAIARPYWTHTLFTTEAPCGCRRRFGLWLTIICAGHVFGPAWEDDAS